MAKAADPNWRQFCGAEEETAEHTLCDCEEYPIQEDESLQ